jgi:hypothetical protein
MAARKLWSSEEDSDSNGATNAGVVIMWIAVSLIALVLFLIVLQCWKRHRITKRGMFAFRTSDLTVVNRPPLVFIPAQLARQDTLLNMPVAVPWEVSGVPYAQVVDIAATAPDHDELLPATEPEYQLHLR